MPISTSGLPVITLAGQWQDSQGTTQRSFSGQVKTSDHADVSEGEYVVVTYRSKEWPILLYEPGNYVLELRELAFPLICFLCEIVQPAAQGACGREETMPHWSATAIPVAPTITTQK